MAYIGIFIAWIIVFFPFGWIGFSFYKALSEESNKWLVATILSFSVLPLYFMILMQIGKDLAL